MGQILYITAFTILSLLAMTNLIRSMVALSRSERTKDVRRPATVSHPELLDEFGNVTTEPLLVLKSLSIEDARTRLDELYNASPND
ncbi:MAG: DUF2973 domain-containing protein [Oscillatoriales cyanobacterium SM2_2_1]|nr:DUF2973 domain-containing protein [Oscillatoriales cyanobacterium SM2_2_1]